MVDLPRLAFDEIAIDTPEGRRAALVVTPTSRIRVGRARLEQVRAGDRHSPVDDAVVDRLAEQERSLEVVLLRSWGGSEDRSWGFSEDLGRAELDDVGYELMRGQLVLFRRMVPLGVSALVATDLVAREFDAIVRGTRRLSLELGERIRAGQAAADAEVDRFIIEHFSLFTTRPYDEFLHQGLPAVFHLVDRHRDKLRALVRDVPGA